MKIIEELYEITDQLYIYLQTKPNEEEKMKYIKKINYYLNKRQEVIDKMKNEYSKDKLSVSNEFIAKDQLIGQELKDILAGIQNDIKKVKQKRMMLKKYGNPYRRLNADGKYFDKRK